MRHHIFLLSMVVSLFINYMDSGHSYAEEQPVLPPAEGDVLSLQEVIAKVLDNHPELNALRWEQRAAEGQVIQVSRRPNPALSMELEGLRFQDGPDQTGTTTSLGFNGGIAAGYEFDEESGPGAGLSDAEFTISIAQELELGKKRQKRRALALREQELIDWDIQRARADLVAEAAEAFVAVLVAQEQHALQQAMTAVAREMTRSSSLRVEAGKASPLEQQRAELELGAASIELAQAELALDHARLHLAALWGDTTATFHSVAADLNTLKPLPDREGLMEQLANNPDVARWVTETALREAALVLEKAERIPNAEIELGLRTANISSGSSRSTGFGLDGNVELSRSTSRFDRDVDNTLVLGFSIELPVFQRNRGNILSAEAQVAKTAEEQRLLERRLRITLLDAYQMTHAAYQEAVKLEESILPGAERTYEKTREGYQQGKFDYLHVLDTRRFLLDARVQQLDALARYHRGIILLERLTGDALIPRTTTSPN